MASIGTLWTVPQQAQGKRIRAVAAFAGLSLDLPAAYTHWETNKQPEFLTKFPLGKIPALETSNGFKLYETQAIARYIAGLAPNTSLLGSNAEDAALVDQWVSLIDSELATPGGIVYGLLIGRIQPYSKPLQTHFADAQLRALKVVEQHLATRTFLVTERITLADITLASVIQRFVGINFDPAIRSAHPNVIRHLETIANQPALKEVFGQITYVEKALAFTPPAKEKKETKPAAAPAAPKPKAEKKEEAEEEDDDDDLVPKEEPKAKNPLDSLPKSSLNLEDWKRAYSNKDTRGADGALEWFYQHFDSEGYSIWRVDFKYNEELTQTFMSANQIGGFFNRLEASRKYLFGSMGVLGETNNSILSGVLIARGQDIKPVVDVAPDWESYNYERIDLKDEKQKQFFEGALAWDLEVDGKKWVDGKNFK